MAERFKRAQPAPAGWYPDPERPGTARYWDGAVWTDHRQPLRETPPPRETPHPVLVWVLLACVAGAGLLGAVITLIALVTQVRTGG